MNKVILKLFLILGYSVPFVFLAMNGDITHNTMFFYLLLILAFGILLFLTLKFKDYTVLIIGNLISIASSFLFMQHYHTDLWDWYFKPFSATAFISTISALVVAVQLLIVFAIYLITTKTTVLPQEKLEEDDTLTTDDAPKSENPPETKKVPAEKAVKYTEFNYRD